VTQFEVAGVFHRPAALRVFAKLADPELFLQPEPSNKFDRNAVKVCGKGKRFWIFQTTVHLGYLPKDLAALVAKTRSVNLLFPRLRMVDVDSSKIVMELTGPKGQKTAFFSGQAVEVPRA
jgi:hypothetical protein